MKSDCAPDEATDVVVVVVVVLVVAVVVLIVVLLEGGGRDLGLKVDLGGLEVELGTSFGFRLALSNPKLAFLGTFITTPVCRPSSLTFADLKARMNLLNLP